MPKLDLEWIEIPAGEFLAGIDRHTIQSRLRAESFMPTKVTEIYNKLVDRMYESVAQELNTSFETPRPLSQQERSVWEQYDDLYTAEIDLARMPNAITQNLKTFYITRYPITSGQYDLFFRADSKWQEKRLLRRPPEPGNLPEETWYGAALAFAEWVDARIPTSLEWEKAARGTDGQLYPWGNEWNVSNGNFLAKLDAPGRPEMNYHQTYKTPVDGYPNGVSPYGVWDMAGNCREWTSTLVNHNYYGEMVVVKANMLVTNVPDFVLANYGPIAINSGNPLWFNNLLSRIQYVKPDTFPMYTSFRLAKDHWDQTIWSGADVSK